MIFAVIQRLRVQMSLQSWFLGFLINFDWLIDWFDWLIDWLIDWWLQDLDTEDSGFVPTERLKELMESLDLFAEEEYVDIMRSKIDPDNLGR